MLAASIPIVNLKTKNSLKKILTKVEEAIPPEIELSDVDIWFQDEARVGQRGTVTRLWTKPAQGLELLGNYNMNMLIFMEPSVLQKIKV